MRTFSYCVIVLSSRTHTAPCIKRIAKPIIPADSSHQGLQDDVSRTRTRELSSDPIHNRSGELSRKPSTQMRFRLVLWIPGSKSYKIGTINSSFAVL